MSFMADHNFEMQFPAILTESNGGPLDDQSYAVGFNMGVVCTILSQATIAAPVIEFPYAFSRMYVEQLDLIAMANKFYTQITPCLNHNHCGEDEEIEFVHVTFVRNGYGYERVETGD